MCLDSLDKGDDLIADALAVKLIEVALVVGRILVADFEIVGFPPGSRNVDITFGTRYDQLALGLHADTDLDGGHGMGISEGNLGEDVEIAIGLIEPVFHTLVLSS